MLLGNNHESKREREREKVKERETEIAHSIEYGLDLNVTFMFFSSWEPLLEFLRFGIFFIGWLCVFQWRGRGNFHISFLSMWKGVLKIWMSCM